MKGKKMCILLLQLASMKRYLWKNHIVSYGMNWRNILFLQTRNLQPPDLTSFKNTILDISVFNIG